MIGKFPIWIGIICTGTLLTGTASAANPVESARWPQFRGPQRSGVSSETGLLTEWPENGPLLVWQAKGAGRGYSSLAIADGRLYTLGDAPSIADDQDEYVLCFDVADGKPIWKTRLGSAWKNGAPSWQSSRSTPTVDGDLVFALTAHGKLFCLESATGKQLWRKDLKQDFGGEKADNWGYSESVLVDGDRLICTPGGEKNTMVALNKRTGELIWSTKRPGDRGAGHSSIVISQVNGIRVYVQMTGSGAMGVRADDGQLLWTHDIERTTAVIPTPIVRDDLVFFTAAYGRGGSLLRQVPAGPGNVDVEEVYPQNRSLANKHGGVILVGDYVYGDTDDRGIPYCADLKTGKLQWKGRGSGQGSASMTSADGYLYIHFANGTMVLAEANPEAYKEVGSFKIPGSGERPSWSYPVIAGGRLYLRENDLILCYDLRANAQ